MLDLPLPLRPVIELKLSSLHQLSAAFQPLKIVLQYHPDITVRTAYDLKPCLRGSVAVWKKAEGSVCAYVDD